MRINVKALKTRGVGVDISVDGNIIEVYPEMGRDPRQLADLLKEYGVERPGSVSEVLETVAELALMDAIRATQ